MTASLALIGVGGIGSYHLASMQKLEQRGLARVVSIVEPMVERFPELKRDLEARGVRWYLNYQDMLQDESDLDAVTIATPIALHLPMALACLDRGLFVNLEKPPVPLVQQLEDLIRADTDQRVTVGFQMVVSRCVQRMKELIAEGAIGEVRSIRAAGCWPRLSRYYQRTGWAGKMIFNGEPVFDGPATNALAHLVHNIMFLAGPTRTDSAVPVEVQGELYRARPIESYDVACLRGTFASGVDFSMAVTHATKKPMPFKMEVRGTGGWLRLSEDGAVLETSAGESLCCPDSTQQLLDLCHEQFVDVMRNEHARTHTTLKDTTGYVRATNGLLLSSGGIHDIDPEWVDQYGEPGDVGYHVRGLHQAVEQVLADGRLFSEMGFDWAVARPVAVRLDSFQTVDLEMGVPLTST